MDIFELKKSDLKSLPKISMSDAFQKTYTTVLFFSERREIDSGYSAMSVVLARDGKCLGILQAYPDSISFENGEHTWHMDSLPKSGAMQVWATGGNRIMKIKVWGASTLYLEPE